MISLESLIASYGIVAIVLGTFLEGETILVLAGFAAHQGYLSLPAVVAAGFAGTFLGDQLYFQIGRRRGEIFLAKRPAWQARVARALDFLEHHHVSFILGFRFLYGLRTVSPFTIGMSDVPMRRFLILDAMGGLIWSVAVASLGYSVGKGAQVLVGRVEEIEVWLFLAIAATGSIAWLIYLASRRRRSSG